MNGLRLVPAGNEGLEDVRAACCRICGWTYRGAMEGEIKCDVVFELFHFILWSSIVSAMRSGIKIEGVTDLSPMLGITTPWAGPAIMFLLPNKGL